MYILNVFKFAIQSTYEDIRNVACPRAKDGRKCPEWGHLMQLDTGKGRSKMSGMGAFDAVRYAARSPVT